MISRPSSTTTGISAYTTRALLAALLLFEIADYVYYTFAEFIHYQDFTLYYKAVERFIQSPLTLYDFAHMATLSEYVYPPLGILILLPLGFLDKNAAYFIFIIGSCVSGVLSAWLVVKTRQHRQIPSQITWQAAATFILITIASGPFFTNFVWSQFNLYVILFCVAAIYLGFEGFAVSGGLMLALACWMKIYPALLLLTMFSVAELRRTAAAAVIWGILLPLCFIWLIPLALYKFYFFKALPEMAGHALIHIDNQSIAAGLTRLSLPVGTWSTYTLTRIAVWIQALNLLFLLLVLGSMYARGAIAAI